MQNKKKFPIILLCIFILLIAAGCGNSNNKENKNMENMSNVDHSKMNMDNNTKK